MGPGRYEANIPGQPLGSIIHYFFRAADVAGFSATEPLAAPAEYRKLTVLPVYFADNAESDKGWTLSAAGDAANGRWVRQNPYGTRSKGIWVEPADDHTPDPGGACFVTGAGQENAFPDQSDVDAGCVNLTSPRIDLQNASQPSVSYWRWFALLGLFQDGSFEAKVSNNDGLNWTTLELVTANANTWTQAVFSLESLLPLTQSMRFRFTACDLGAASLVEAAMDDFLITMTSSTSSIGDPPHRPTLLGPNWPNPFTLSTHIRLNLPYATRGTLTIHDASGRRVRTLLTGLLEEGPRVLAWDGRNERGQRVATGIYFCDLRSDAFTARNKLLLLK